MVSVLALVVGDGELLGVVGQDADAVDAGVDHEVDGALLALQVKLAVVVEGGRGDREDARVDGAGHGLLLGRSGCQVSVASRSGGPPG